MDIQIVKAGASKYLLQVPCSDSRWGFYLTDGVNAWDGGYYSGLKNWTVVSEIPLRLKRVRSNLESTRHAILNNYGYPVLSRYKFVNEANV